MRMATVVMAFGALAVLTLPAKAADVMKTPALRDVRIQGYMAKKMMALIRERCTGEFARTEIFGEARRPFKDRDDDIVVDGESVGGYWRGEFWGKLMLSAARVADYLGDPEYVKWIDEECHRLIAFQDPDGYLGSYRDKDKIATRLYSFVAERINKTRNGHSGTYQAGFWSIDNDITFGRVLAATPDGRRRGEMLSRNNVATTGCGKEGPTAVMLSNAKLDVREAANGHIVDILMPVSRDLDRTCAAERVASILETHARMGGQCIHFNCFDSGMLREAQANPDRYPDLQVRVCGWNVRWNDLSKIEQDMFIRMAEAQE